MLADLADVLAGSSDRVKLAEFPARLRKLAPSWRQYRDLNGTQLRTMLDAEGVKVTNTGNVLRLDPDDLRRVLNGRDQGE